MNELSSIPAFELPPEIAARPLAGRRVLIVVENLPLPFDRRVWQQARTLVAAGAEVSVICPRAAGYEEAYELLEGVHIHRHPLPFEASSAPGFVVEYLIALCWETWLAWKIHFTRGFDVIQGCNPPDLVFLLALPFKAIGKRYIFDHHDINPELYEAKFGKRGWLWRMLRLLEWFNFKVADVSIATNHSYRQIALDRGGMAPDKVFVVRSGPDLSRLKPVAPNPAWRNGRRFLVGYVGVMGQQEGMDLLIEAAALLVQRHGRHDIQFCLVGDGPSLAGLKQMAADRGVAPYITFAGRAPDEELLEMLSTMDIGVNPDRVNAMNDKSTMNKIMEYMALAKPIVQFAVCEGRYSAGAASLYARANDPADFAQKIVDLLEDPAQRREMGLFGRRRVEHELSWRHQVGALIEAYQEAFRRR